MRFILFILAIAPAFGQTYNIITVAPNPAASAVGRLRFAEKSNSATRHYLQIEGPDSLGANVRYKFDGTTTAGCLSLGAASGGVNTITTGGCNTWPLVVPNGTAAPQFDATGLGAALNINGSATTNGNIVFNPGAVAGAASVFVNASRLDWPGFVIQNKTGTTTSDVMQILDSSGVAQMRVTGSTNSSAPSSIFLGLPTNALGLVGPSIVVQNVVGSLSDPTNGSGITMAATPSSGGADLSVFKIGTGTLLPLRFFRNPTEVARFDGNNHFLIGRTTDDGSLSTLQVAGPTSIGGALIPASTTTYQLGTAGNVWSHTWTSDITVESHLILTGSGAPQIDATGTNAALNINGASAFNGNIVLNPGPVTGLSSVQINGANNSNVLTEALIINDVGGAAGSGITMKHGGTFDAAWQSGTSASFDVVGNGVTHLFVLDQSGVAIRYQALATAGVGVVPVYATASATGSTASIGTTALLVGGGTAPAGTYRVSVYVLTNSAGSGNVSSLIGWNDGVSAKTIGGGGVILTSGNQTSATTILHTSGSSNITYSTTYTSSGSYDFYITMERLQ